MTGATLELRYYFDPLCGWCYASALALEGLAERFPDGLVLMPSGLFMNARPVSQMAEHAWRNDRRIAALTGQRFTEDYHRKVLQAPARMFDSTALTFSLVALGEADRRLEARFLHAAQVARYVGARDTSLTEVAVEIAVAVAADAGLVLDAGDFTQGLSDPSLGRRVAERLAATQADLAGFRTQGVPQLLLIAGEQRYLLDGQDLYSGPGALLDRIDQLLSPVRAG